ncbi:unnamed protein product, partial [Polarella glacialis]
VLSCIPEITSTKLAWADKQTKRLNSFVLLFSRPVAEAFTHEELVKAASEFPGQPRAAVGEITTKALEKVGSTAQCAAVQVWLLPGGPTGGQDEGAENASEGPAKKKAKTTGQMDMSSARLRHILIRYQ